MTILRLVGWNKGIKTVSLIVAIRDYSTGSLADARRLVDDLIGGSEVTLTFSDETRKNEFRQIAVKLGALVK